MTEPQDGEKSAWIRRVLGVEFAVTGDITATPAALSNADAGRSFRLADGEAEVLQARGDAARAQMLRDRASALRREGGLRQAIAGWRAARAVAVNTLTMLEAAMRGSDAAERDAAIILVRGARARLVDTPNTADTIRSMTRYLENDPIVSAVEGPNIFGIRVSLRQPLGAALAVLGKALHGDGESG